MEQESTPVVVADELKKVTVDGAKNGDSNNIDMAAINGTSNNNGLPAKRRRPSLEAGAGPDENVDSSKKTKLIDEATVAEAVSSEVHVKMNPTEHSGTAEKPVVTSDAIQERVIDSATVPASADKSRGAEKEGTNVEAKVKESAAEVTSTEADTESLPDDDENECQVIDDLEQQLEMIVEGKSSQGGQSSVSVEEPVSTINLIDTSVDTTGAIEDKSIGKLDDSVVVLDKTETTGRASDLASMNIETPNMSLNENLGAVGDKLGRPSFGIVLSNGGSSTPNSNNATSVDFNGTPIKKQLADEVGADTDDKTCTTTDVSSHEDASIVSTDGEKSKSDVMGKSDEEMERLKMKLKPSNGHSSSPSFPSDTEDKLVGLLPYSLNTTLADGKAEYEASVYFEGNSLQYLHVMRIKKNLAEVSSDVGSEKSTSNGSVLSLGPFAFPAPRERTTSALSNTSSLSSNNSGKFPTNPLATRTVVTGGSGLRSFLEELLKKLPATTDLDQSNSAKKASRTISRGRNNKASGTGDKKVAEETDDQDSMSGKSDKSGSNKALSVSFDLKSETIGMVGNFVMARWTDKKYYAGRIQAEKTGNKYTVHFDDGASKTLPSEHIVFGDKNVAPLLNREVNVLVEGNIYETGLVVAIDPNTCKYSVVTDTRTVMVAAKDLYLDEEQAKALTGTPKAGGSKDEPMAAASAGTTSRRKRKDTATDALNTSAEAGPSTQVDTNKKSRKRQQQPMWSPPQIQSSDTQFSDLSDTFEADVLPPPQSPESSFIEAIDGVQPEYIKCPNETKILLTCGIFNDEQELGPLPASNQLFRNKHFLLTCTVLNRNYNNNNHMSNGRRKSEGTDGQEENQQQKNVEDAISRGTESRHHKFTHVPFVMDHLIQQLRSGGATVYIHFEDVPKVKYKTTILITPAPCLTARYVQCLAANMQIVNHEWVVACCRQNQLLHTKPYELPMGWSILSNCYVRRGTDGQPRSNTYPLINRIIMISSENEDFIKFWGRVCKLAGAKIKAIKTVMDITANKKGFLLTDSEILAVNIEKAKAVNVPIVSTTWLIECLVSGKMCAPDAHVNLTKINWDFDS